MYLNKQKRLSLRCIYTLFLLQPMEKPVGIERRNVRAAARGDDDGSLCLSHHAVITLYLCLLPLGHLSLLFYWVQIYAKLACFHGRLAFLQGCSSLFGRIPRHPFYLFLVKIGQNRLIHRFVPPIAVTCQQKQVVLPTVNIGNGKDQVGGNSDLFLCPNSCGVFELKIAIIGTF